MKPGRKCPNQHRDYWAMGRANSVTWLWCYECGAIRLLLGDGSWDRWIYPTGIGGENPAVKGKRE